MMAPPGRCPREGFSVEDGGALCKVPAERDIEYLDGPLLAALWGGVS